MADNGEKLTQIEVSFKILWFNADGIEVSVTCNQIGPTGFPLDEIMLLEAGDSVTVAIPVLGCPNEVEP